MPPVSEQHAQHDPLSVVSLAAGDLTGPERDDALSLVADCTSCAAIHDDVLAIARATAVLPPAVRPREFQISPEQAARLRPAGWRRFVAAFASPRLAMTRQLGVGLTTLGLAGLMVSVLPTIPIGGMGSAAGASAAPEMLTASDGSGGRDVQESGRTVDGASQGLLPAAASAAPSPAAPQASGSGDSAALPFTSGRPSPTMKSDGGVAVAPNVQATDEDTAFNEADPPGALGTTGDEPTSSSSPLLVASLILLAAGIALLIARRLARGMSGT